MPLIEVKDVAKIYQMGKDVTVTALQDIELTIEEGEFLAIMGPSGSGKSTLMHILGCLDRPSRGFYLLKDQRVENLDDQELSRTRNKEIGFVFQFFNLLPQLNVLQNVELPLTYAGVPARRRRTLAIENIKIVGLEDRKTHLPSELSGGQRQRVALARAMVNNPAILMADEPTGNLDTKTGAEIMKLFQAINQRGKTVILVTHESEIAKYAHRIVHLRDGQISQIESL